LKRIVAGEGIDPAKIVVMPNGVDLAAFGTAPDATRLRQKLGLTGATVIGFVGWFRPWHGLEMLIDAFHRAGLGGKGAKLLLIGDGPATPALRRQVAALGLEDCVVFAGAVPHDAIPDYLALVDIAAQPAANAYCCPMKVIEYMAMSKPIVAPRQDNITELLAEDREALTFAPGDVDGMAAALARLVASAEDRARLGAAARQAIDDRGLLWSRNAARVVELAGA
jgi:glycosyltransferase involved in cell wall biosynthesis